MGGKFFGRPGKGESYGVVRAGPERWDLAGWGEGRSVKVEQCTQRPGECVVFL